MAGADTEHAWRLCSWLWVQLRLPGRVLTEVRLTFTASVSHCPLGGATCSSPSQQLEGSVEELSQMSCESNAGAQ